jgi:hypothetical protein
MIRLFLKKDRTLMKNPLLFNRLYRFGSDAHRLKPCQGKEKTLCGVAALHKAFWFQFIAFVAVIFCMVLPAQGAEPNQAHDPKDAESQFQGVFYNRIDPSFYTGFAPRCQDPERIHIHLGRGNQIRVTVVLSNEIIDSYLPDLAKRYRTYEKLIQKGIIRLTQNMAYEKFSRIISREHILKLAEEKGSMDSAKYRQISLSMLEKLNPGKIFHIKIDLTGNCAGGRPGSCCYSTKSLPFRRAWPSSMTCSPLEYG